MSADLGFGVPIFSAYGIPGVFSVASSDGCATTARFVMTKVRPAGDGSWETKLVSKLRPWREVFPAERSTFDSVQRSEAPPFDELLQRELDDSRVAMDLIPYLLGEGKNVSRFFPPILAILVPTRPDKTGIFEHYPAQNSDVRAPSQRFGNLFRVDPHVENGQQLPLTELVCNDAKSGFVIADGQHRAMAVLAIHRLLTRSWDRDPYATYYQHIQVDPEQVKELELPVCIVYFPELTENNLALKARGVTLTRVCRDLFLTVNKQAKAVSNSRQLLLDDEDLAARMMRHSLSRLKDRAETDTNVARIYSFAFGDADSEFTNAQDLSGRQEYSSAMLLHRVHLATCFSPTGALSLESDRDLTDKRVFRGSQRAPEILKGTDFGDWNSIGKNSGRIYAEDEVRAIVQLLGDYSDLPLFALFDRFCLFVAHNREMAATSVSLMDTAMRADPVQARCHSLLFEGSGARGIFEMHCERIAESIKEAGAQKPSSYVENQDKAVRAVKRALETWDLRIKRGRALRFLRIEPFGSAEQREEPSIDADRETVGTEAEKLCRGLFATATTQAFQLGFCAAVHGAVRVLCSGEPPRYDERMRLTRMVAEAWVAALNSYFSPGTGTHRVITKEMKENTRLGVFEPDREGLRALLALSVRELNEGQYTFFRSAVLELCHCAAAVRTLIQTLRAEDAGVADSYLAKLPEFAALIIRLRTAYLNRGCDAVLRSDEIKMQITRISAVAEARSESVEDQVEAFRAEQKKQVQQKVTRYLNAAVGDASMDADALLRRMTAAATGA